MSVYIHKVGAGRPGADFTVSRIVHESVLRDPATTITATQTGGTSTSGAANVATPTTFDTFQCAGAWTSFSLNVTHPERYVDAVCVASHNLGSLGCAVTVTVGADSVTFTPDDDSPIMVFFDKAGSAGTTALTISATRPAAPVSAVAHIGVVFAGKALEAPHAIFKTHEPSELRRSVTRSTTTSVNGQALGLAVRRVGSSASFNWGMVLPEYLYGSAFRAFRDYAEVGAGFFFVAWRPDYAPVPGQARGAFYGCLSAGVRAAPNGTSNFFSLSFEMESAGRID